MLAVVEDMLEFAGDLHLSALQLSVMMLVAKLVAAVVACLAYMSMNTPI